MPNQLLDDINASAVEERGANDRPTRTLAQRHIRQLADRHGIAAQRVEIEALENGVLPTRYLRNQTTFTVADQLRLLKSRVAVIGLGGLGGMVVEILARIGVGRMVLVDGDHFEDHNLNRQLLCTQDQIGCGKATAAQKRVDQINGAVTVEHHGAFLTAENAPQLIKGCDVVVDCLDTIPSRFDLEAAARQNGIPMVSAAVAGLAGQVTTIFPQDAGLQLVYGPAHTLQKTKGAETILGCPPQAVTMVAAMESAEVIKILLGRNNGLLRNKLWIVDLTNNTFEVLSLGG